MKTSEQALGGKSRPKPYLPFPLPALERTFLGYLRTALALSMISVIIAQLYRLQHAPNPNNVFGYFVLSIALACVCIGAAIVVLLFGAYRFWRQQNAILRGKVHAGGWEVNAIGLTISLVRIYSSRGGRKLIVSLGYSHPVRASCGCGFTERFSRYKLIRYVETRSSRLARYSARAFLMRWT